MDFSEFHTITLPTEQNLFNELMHSVDFETTGKGRLGNHLVDVQEENIPIVRTTTRFNTPAVAFSPIHHQLVADINDTLLANHIDIPVQNFNNSLIEVYDVSYAKMGFHSDQALDLEKNSFIALFTCYEQPDELEESHMRKLVIKDKTTEEESEIVLQHYSVILFSVESNRRFQHKIVLHSPMNSKTMHNNRWLGLTFRTSKTSIQFKDKIPYFSAGELLTLANADQESEFFKLRGQENRELDFTYPPLLYTISNADLLPPVTKI
ncbi:alpha-ketoglutarate-dependent dioxygenase AlkB [Chryseobacterium sp.]|uniref:alpha-ketoglutarate-dependent dioxygenase AlkB n=1 Tax=Chryseobacterium sp. TaxID=1871047 RepID=UPI00321BB071